MSLELQEKIKGKTILLWESNNWATLQSMPFMLLWHETSQPSPKPFSARSKLDREP